MRAVNIHSSWFRTVLCGIVTGGVWTVLSVIVLVLWGEEFLRIVDRRTAASSAGDMWLMFSNIAGAVWALWLYTVLRGRYTPGVRMAALAGVSWWLLATLQSGKWMTMLGVPAATVVALVPGTLLATVAATIAGAWLWERARG
jgi:hypothetical protein